MTLEEFPELDNGGRVWGRRTETANSWFLGKLRGHDMTEIFARVERRTDGAWNWYTRDGRFGTEPTRVHAMKAAETFRFTRGPGRILRPHR